MSAVASAWRWARRQIGRRGAFLAFLVLLDWVYGWSLLSAPREMQTLDLLLPWEAWGWLWVACGVVVVTGVFAHRDRLQFAVSAMFKTAWALLWLELWVVKSSPDAWVSVVVWAAFAGVVVVVSGWPESKTAPVVGEFGGDV